MSRFEETETALTERLRVLHTKPEMTIKMFDLTAPLGEAGYSPDEIMEVLLALEQDRIVALATGNRLKLLKPLP